MTPAPLENNSPSRPPQATSCNRHVRHEIPSTHPDQIALANLGLVASVARRYRFPTVPQDDVIQAGNVGLLRAARSYDPERAGDLSTWLSFGIRRAILEHLAAFQHPVALPRNLHQRLVRPADDPTGASIRPPRPVPITGSADDPERCDRILPPADDHAPAAAERSALIHDVRDLLDALDLQSRTLVAERFGLGDGRPRGTGRQASDRGVSRETIRLRFNRAMATLAAEARARQLDTWLEG